MNEGGRPGWPCFVHLLPPSLLSSNLYTMAQTHIPFSLIERVPRPAQRLHPSLFSFHVFALFVLRHPIKRPARTIRRKHAQPHMKKILMYLNWWCPPLPLTLLDPFSPNFQPLPPASTRTGGRTRPPTSQSFLPPWLHLFSFRQPLKNYTTWEEKWAGRTAAHHHHHYHHHHASAFTLFC